MSLIALISDIHANYPALQAVLKQLEKEKPDVWICLGDVVGYGPHPKQCIEEVRNRGMICVKGNHDAGVTGELSLKHFKNPNRSLITQTRQLITEEQLEWLSSLPFVFEDKEQQWIAAHASPIKPERWEYLESAFQIREMLPKLKQPLCFVGHTHRPALAADSIGVNTYKPGHSYLINPGSVGQSRDDDTRASCALIDTGQHQYKNIRIAYDIAPVLNDLEQLGFSQKEAKKLMRV